MLLSIFVIIYTLLGMNLFAYQVAFNEENHLDLVNGAYPIANFNNFLEGFYTVFLVLTNAWTAPYLDHYRAKPIEASIFFISLLIVG